MQEYDNGKDIWDSDSEYSSERETKYDRMLDFENRY